MICHAHSRLVLNFRCFVLDKKSIELFQLYKLTLSTSDVICRFCFCCGTFPHKKRLPLTTIITVVKKIFTACFFSRNLMFCFACPPLKSRRHVRKSPASVTFSFETNIVKNID